VGWFSASKYSTAQSTCTGGGVVVVTVAAGSKGTFAPSLLAL
jgi:hypothetical protein